ncbi:class F sortase [Actinomycetospora sp. TBRC 11914]|uniref:class F sortase n=1 Tax=Actinomycetospora sp. TBRC 11914 TaxID=2729387 RepID=UPI00145DBAD8|nr:class F sortase [Actinomycetospora sp. TBRC 11914]NMO90432.1 class F sortase [Actinomycetospora sp. TBRC 11914]
MGRQRAGHRRWLWIGGSAVAVLAVAVGTVGVVGVREATADPGTGMLRLAHLSPNTPAVDMYATGSTLPLTKVASDVSYRAVSPYLTEPAGTYRIQGRTAGAPASSPPLFDVAVDLPAGSAQTATFVDIGPNGATQAQVLDDETAPAAAGSGALRIVQAAAEVGPLDVEASDPSGHDADIPLARTLFYGSATPYATVAAHPWSLRLTTRSGKESTLQVPVTSTSVASLVVTRGADGDLAAQVVPDAASAAGVPSPAPGAPPVAAPPAPRTAESSAAPVAPGSQAPQPPSAQAAPETSTPPAPKAPSPPDGGIGAGLGGTSREDLGVFAAGGIWDTIESWFGAGSEADPGAPFAVRMPLAIATAPPAGGPHPTSLDIPAIGLDVGNPIDLRIDYRGALQVPTDYTQVGWFTSSAVPGDPGSSVMVGHVDDRNGPAVFGRLDDLKPGDTIEVGRSDGGTARFGVDSVETFGKDNLPTERVYGPTTTPSLRLMTCGGPFDQATLNYRDNIVVFATPR